MGPNLWDDRWSAPTTSISIITVLYFFDVCLNITNTTIIIAARATVKREKKAIISLNAV